MTRSNWIYPLLLILLIFSGCESEQDTSTDNATSPQSQPERPGPRSESSSLTNPAEKDQTFKILDISERNKDGKNGIAILLSSAIDTANDIQPYITINHSHNGQVEGSWLIGDQKKMLWFMNVEPQNTYHITVNPGLKGADQTVLMESLTRTISTRALQPSVNFESSGSILPLGYASGLPVATVNIDQIDIDFFRIKDDQIAGFIEHSRHYGRSGWYARTLKAFGELSYSARFDLFPPKNTRTVKDLDFKSIEALSKPGLYFAVMRAAGDYEEKHITWFSITDIGLHVRQYSSQMDVHVSSLSTGKPLKGVELELLNSKSVILQQNRTTPEGLASFSGDLKNASVLVAKTDKQYTVLNLNQPALDLSEFDLGSRPQLPLELFLYSPRDLYRPGEPITISGLIRNFDGKLSQTPTLKAEFRSPQHTTARSFRWQPDENGYLEQHWVIPPDAATGKWQLYVEGVLQKPVSYEFNVEEFLPERLKLTLAKGKSRTELRSATESIQLDILGEYLYGAPASGNRLSSFVTVNHWRSPIESLKNFQFGHVLDTGFSSYNELNDIQLDNDGHGLLTVPSDWSNSYSPLEVKITTSLYESGGRPITRAHSALIWPKESLIGIRPHFGDKNPDANSTVKFDLINANLAGDFLAANDIEIVLIREDRMYFWEFNSHQGWHWNWTDKEFPVSQMSVNLEKGKAKTLSLPVDWGNYRLEVRNPENNSTSSIRFFAGYDWYRDWKNANSDGAARPDKVNLALDKPFYKSGDTAQLKIIPPEAGEAIIIVENDKPLWSKKISVAKEGATVSIPISNDWQTHDIYISALVLQPAGKTISITPKRSLGLIHLPLDRNDRKLNLSITAPEKILPESTLTAQLNVKNPDGSIPSKAHVTLAAVDIGVLNITDFATPDPFEFFFGQRRYSVDTKDIYSDVIEVNKADKAKQRFGGDADLVRGGKKPQSDVQIISLFSGVVPVNQNGQADIALDIPNFNGALRLMGLAYGDKEFGSSDQEIKVAAPIIAEIAMPRFLAKNDEAIIALDLRNMTDQTQTLQVGMNAEGAGSLEGNTEEVTLDANQKATLHYNLQANAHEGFINLRANIQGNDIQDFNRQWNLGVRPAYPAITHHQKKFLKQGETFSLDAKNFDDILQDTLQASVSISPVVDLHLADQLQNLLQYPYGCLEQTSSRAYPLTFATQENQARFQLNPMAEEQRLDMIQKGVDRILTFQRSDGSFGLWDRNSPEEHWLTNYATDFLLNAKEMGMNVPEEPLNKALNRLTSYLNSSGNLFGQRWSSDPKHYGFSTRAYAGYVLSRVKRAPLGSLRTLYQRGFNHANSGLSQVYLGLALMNMGDKKKGEEALGKAVENLPTEYHYWGDYGSQIRDLGMMVHLLLRNKQQEEKALELSLELHDALSSRRWLSTQERISLFLAGIALEDGLSRQWSGEWFLGDSKNSLQQKHKWSRLFDAKQLEAGFDFTSLHDKPLYTNALINGYGAKAPEPVSHGMHIERTWYNLQGKEVLPSTVQSGDLFMVHLALNSGQRNPDALVVNLLPAGFELENQNLGHSVNLDLFTIDNKKLSELQARSEIKHQEYRDDRYVAAVDLKGYGQTHLFFLVRAVTPGTYQVPPPMVEDMYRPELRSMGSTLPSIQVVNPE